MGSGESFTYNALCKRQQAGTITPAGAAWLVGYERARQHAVYAQAYGLGDNDLALMPPKEMPDDLVGYFTSGAMQATEDQND